VAPDVDVYVLLDVLLMILIALFIPIGFWRGAFREAFVTLGILFGAMLGIFWGETWGADLASITRLHESGGAFMIAMLCLISSTFLLGYSAGAAVPVPRPGWIARSLGALIAGTNGALLLSFALRDIRVYLLSAQDSNFLDSAVIAPFLSEGTGWLMLVAAAVFVPIALVVALFGPQIQIDDYYETGEFDTYDDDEFLPYPERTAPAGHSTRSFGAESQRAVPSAAEETRPIPSTEARDVSTGSAQRSSEDTTDEYQREFGHVHVSNDGAGGSPHVSGETDPNRCPTCRADIRNADVYCQSCGRMI
jgi:uncharacterized membrane protein required for colicin V production